LECFLGIDLGTSAVKAILADDTGACLGIRERRYPIRQPQPGFAEQAPEAWWQAAAECVRDLFAGAAADPKLVCSIGLSGQMHGLVMLDASGTPLRDAIIWPDTRTSAICREWSAESGNYHSITGLPIATGFLAPSLEWVRRFEPDLYGRTVSVLLPKDYLRFKLTGRIATDPSDASGTYLFDITSRRWAAGLVDTLGLDQSLLPDLLETLSLAGELTAEAAAALGLSAGIPVAVGGSDQAMAALALGLTQPDQVAVALSTGGTIITPVKEPLVDRRLHTLCHAFSDQWLLMGATLTGGAALSWLNDQVLSVGAAGRRRRKVLTVEELGGLAEEVSAGSDGLFFLPYLSGERTPHMNPNAQGSLVGLTLYHTTAHIVRAIMEGVVYSLCDSVEIFQEHGVRPANTLCYAGGSRSSVWRQIIADVFGIPVIWGRFSDYSALGAALCAAAAVGEKVEARNGDGSSGEDVRRPDPMRVAMYRKRHETFKRLYARLEPLFDEIADYRRE
jgi:xylulokinase